MKIKQDKEKEWIEYKKIYSKDLYSNFIITYLQRWADLMEKKIAEYSNDIPNDIILRYAEELSREADIDGITGFMYGCAVNVLSELWEYGEILKQWHNQQYHYNGDGVVNPAIFTVKF